MPSYLLYMQNRGDSSFHRERSASFESHLFLSIFPASCSHPAKACIVIVFWGQRVNSLAAPEPPPGAAHDSAFLQIFRLQSGPLGNSPKHARANFLVIVKCEDIIWPTGMGKNAVGSFGLTLDAPSAAQKGGKHLPSFARRPLSHVGTAKSSSSSGMPSP